MARSRDTALRLELLDRVVEYLAANGLGAASLRPIAQALDVSLNRLVHHFGTKQELVAAALDRVIEIQVEVEQSWLAKRPDMSQMELHRRWWKWMNASPANLALTRLDAPPHSTHLPCGNPLRELNPRHARQSYRLPFPQPIGVAWVRLQPESTLIRSA